VKEISVLALLIDDKKFGIDITDILNILDINSFTPKNEFPEICGLIVSNDTQIPVIDLKQVMFNTKSQIDKMKSILIVKMFTHKNEFEVGMLIDTVSGTYDVTIDEKKVIQKIIDDFDNEISVNDIQLIDAHALLSQDEKVLLYKKHYRHFSTTPQ
jgi:chemotaxis signal transduction protein